MAASPFKSFIFGGNTGETPDSLKRKRAIAEQILGRSGSPRTIAEGISSIGDALMYRKLAGDISAGEQVEQGKTDAALGRFNSALPSLFGASGAGAGFGGATSAIADSTTPAASVPKGEVASYARDGLIKRGLPEHVADAFVVNFQDESGLNPGISEKNPTVAGSRGGYGLYQLTGPRRREYEAFAAQRGISPSSVDGQLDFLMGELGGKESDAAKKILSAPDTATAAQAIVTNFLRPSPKLRDQRVAKYGRLSALEGAPQVPLPETTRQPQGVQVASNDPSFMPEMPAEEPQRMAGLFIGTPEEYEASKQQSAPPPDAMRQAIRAQITGEPMGPLQTLQPPVAPVPQNIPIPQAAPRQQAMQAVQQAPVSQPQPDMAGLDPRTSPEARALLASGTFDGFGFAGQRGTQPSGGLGLPAIPGAPDPQPAQPMQPQAQSADMGGQRLQSLIQMASDPYLPAQQREIVSGLIEQEMGRQQMAEKQRLNDASPDTQLDRRYKQAQIAQLEAPQGPQTTDDIREFQFAQQQGFTGDFNEYITGMKRAGAQSITMGGGQDKQVFDAVAESAASARSAVGGLRAIQNARAAVEAGGIFGGGADTRLALQKLGASLGVVDPSAIQNTETFRAAIAPQISAVLKSTVGTANISNTDREFAEKAAGGNINLDEGSIRRLLGIMEKVSIESVRGHQSRLDRVYPPGQTFERERALFGVDLPSNSEPQSEMPPDVNEEDIQHTMKVHGLTREQVLERLR